MNYRLVVDFYRLSKLNFLFEELSEVSFDLAILCLACLGLVSSYAIVFTPVTGNFLVSRVRGTIVPLHGVV
jgi:hypothetical protein